MDQSKTIYKRIVTLLFSCVFVDYLGIGLVYPVFASMIFDQNLALIDAAASSAYRGAILGILIALTPIFHFFFSPILGKYSDIYGRKKALQIGMLCAAIGYVFAVIGVHYEILSLLFIYRILIGIANSTAAVAQASLADVSNKENKVRGFSLMSAAFGIGFTVGPFMGGVVSDSSIISWFNYTIPFILAGILSLFNLTVVIAFFPEIKRKAVQGKISYLESFISLKRVLEWPSLKWIFIGGFALSFAWSYFNEFIPVLLQHKMGFTPSQNGNFYAYGGIWYAFFALFCVAPLVKKFPYEKLAAVVLIGAAFCKFAFAYIESLFVMAIVIPLMSYFIAIAYPTSNAMLSDRTELDKQGEVFGIYQSVQALAMGICPLVFGTLVGIYPTSVAIGSAISLLFASFAFKKSMQSSFVKAES